MMFSYRTKIINKGNRFLIFRVVGNKCIIDIYIFILVEILMIKII